MEVVVHHPEDHQSKVGLALEERERGSAPGSAAPADDAAVVKAEDKVMGDWSIHIPFDGKNSVLVQKIEVSPVRRARRTAVTAGGERAVPVGS